MKEDGGGEEEYEEWERRGKEEEDGEDYKGLQRISSSAPVAIVSAL